MIKTLVLEPIKQTFSLEGQLKLEKPQKKFRKNSNDFKEELVKVNPKNQYTFENLEKIYELFV
jgi:hypothetical protein